MRSYLKKQLYSFHGGSVVKTPPTNAGDMGWIIWSKKIPCALEQLARAQLLNLCSRAWEPQLLSPRGSTTEAQVP